MNPENQNDNLGGQGGPQKITTSNQPFFGFGTANTGVGNTEPVAAQPTAQAANPVAEPAPNASEPVQTAPSQVPADAIGTTSILSPTHFDDLQAEQQAAAAAAAAAAEAAKNAPKAPEDPQKTIKKFMILSVVLGVATVIFLFLGIWGLVDAASTRKNLEATTKENNNLTSIIDAIEEQTETVIQTVEDVPVYQPASDYIYLTDWGIKLRIPETLTSVSYILDQNADYRPSVCFNAVKSGVQYFPAFADVKQNPGGMGCLWRISIADGEKDASGNSFGQKVFTNEDFNYFYKEPSKTYSSTDAEKGLEATAVQLIKNMITDNISTYK